MPNPIETVDRALERHRQWCGNLAIYLAWWTAVGFALAAIFWPT